MVGEYTYGLPLLLFFRGGLTKELLDRSISPTRYKILIRMDDDELQHASLLVSICFNQNMILYETSFIRLELRPSLN
jgi:hypothetical protein